MVPRKLKVMIGAYSYGGCGGISSEHPDVRDWMLKTIPKMKADERVEAVCVSDIADTPITMSRNQMVIRARKWQADVLIMIDSDMSPDSELREDIHAKPFWESSFDYLYSHYDRGPVCIGAPYCGPPPFENVYIFRWTNDESDSKSDSFRLEGYTRYEATIMDGIKEVAALPTGLIMYDMRCFEITEPKSREEKPWFYYEFPDQFEAEKCSTEDVTQTRDLSLTGLTQLGYNPVLCNWSAWAGHWKPKCVRKPNLLTPDAINKKYQDAMKRLPWGEKLVDVGSLVTGPEYDSTT